MFLKRRMVVGDSKWGFRRGGGKGGGFETLNLVDFLTILKV